MEENTLKEIQEQEKRDLVGIRGRTESARGYLQWRMRTRGGLDALIMRKHRVSVVTGREVQNELRNVQCMYIHTIGQVERDKGDDWEVYARSRTRDKIQNESQLI
jgi:hypothetical protein